MTKFTDRELLDLLAQRPNSPAQVFADILGVHRASVIHRLKKLSAWGMVQKVTVFNGSSPALWRKVGGADPSETADSLLELLDKGDLLIQRIDDPFAAILGNSKQGRDENGFGVEITVRRRTDGKEFRGRSLYAFSERSQWASMLAKQISQGRDAL